MRRSVRECEGVCGSVRECVGERGWECERETISFQIINDKSSLITLRNIIFQRRGVFLIPTQTVSNRVSTSNFHTDCL